jgi:hypothetical protein
MGSWFSKEEPVVIANNINSVSKELTIEKNMNSLNLSLEEILKEVAIIIAIVSVWEIIKRKINKKAQSKALKMAKSTSNINTI